ncbi:hypothetical protein PanWU01x14_107120 [Parasponia andersonii]|uniref:DUF630 family protein n=1 Tax=Parasponia andersonii TaxID=3476 RepID=A0A2P5D0C4_PARAD|nr:hypothetical protein PanWU01x14_107120 [Parasponia andersonii]
MGCATSKKDEEDDVILLCKERKRLLKMAVERRSELADAQCKYNNSLYAVAAAIRLFVSRYSSPCSPFLITFPSTTTTTTSETNKTFISKPMFLQQRPSELTHKTIPCLFESSKLDGQNEENPEEKEEEVDEQEEESDKNKDEESESQEILVCDHFYGEMASPMPLPQGEFQWDFFSPFDGVVRTEEVVSGFGQNSDEDLRAVRAKEGIPDLEEDGEKVTTSVGNPVDVSMSNGIVCKGRDGNVSQGENECLRVIDTPSDGRELLEALKDVVDLFIRAYDSGLDVSRMLETNMVQVQSALEGIQENSNKLIRSITRSRSTSPTLSWSSSCKTLLTSSSKSSSTWTEFKSDMFDDYGGMESGSHSLTLGRTLVSIRRAESISERVQKLRDQELQPQLIELLHG